MRYFLFIDGKMHGSYSTLEEAQKQCYCGDVFRIYLAHVVFEENRTRENRIKLRDDTYDLHFYGQKNDMTKAEFDAKWDRDYNGDLDAFVKMLRP